MSENYQSYINKRCQIKKSGERGMITGISTKGSRTLLNVDLDKNDVTSLQTIDSLYIEDNLYKYPQYEPSNQRDNAERTIRQPTSASSNSGQVISAPVTHSTTVLRTNSENIGTGDARRNRNGNTSRSNKRRHSAIDVESSEEEATDDSNSHETVENEAPSSDEWTTVENVFEEKGHVYTGSGTRLRWDSVGLVFSDAGVKDPIQYFRLMFPMNSVSRILQATNEGLRDNDKINDGDFWRYIGIRLAFVLSPVPFGMKDGAFGTGTDEETLFEKGNYGAKYGMSRNRFFFIDENLKFCTFTDAEKQQVHV